MILPQGMQVVAMPLLAVMMTVCSSDEFEYANFLIRRRRRDLQHHHHPRDAGKLHTHTHTRCQDEAECQDKMSVVPVI